MLLNTLDKNARFQHETQVWTTSYIQGSSPDKHAVKKILLAFKIY
jgi:hypothetical protein